MVKSMTGFGRGSGSCDNYNITVEIKSVNHRYFEYNSRMPKSLSFMDDKLKGLCQSRISRGKVEIFVTLECLTGSDTQIVLNEDFANSYIAALKTLSEKYGITDDISVSTVAANSDVFTIKKAELDEEAISNAVLSAADEAIDGFIAMRIIEGEKLKDDVEKRIEYITEKVRFIEERSPETVKLYRQRIEQKIRELLDSAQVDEQRLLTETAIFAEKVAVAEETVRLMSHMSQLKTMLSMDEPVGRKIDFIVQEMNREANTIGSKAQDVEIAHCVVDIKSEIEKIREQIQNIE